MKFDPLHIKTLQQSIALYEDMRAYEQLYELFYASLKRFSYSFVKSPEIAEEIVSDVFIKIWEIRTKLPEIDNLRIYLYTIAKNFSLNYIIKSQKQPVVSLDKIDIEAVITLNTPEEWLIAGELNEKIQQAIREMPPQCRLIFKLVKEDGLKYREVAEILNLSPLTVRNQMSIAIGKIREVIGLKSLTMGVRLHHKKN